MSFNSLLSADEKSAQSTDNRQRWFIAGLLLLLVSVGGGGVYWFYLKPKNKIIRPEQKYAREKIRETVVMFLAQPKFTGKEFAAQILGKANLELYRVDKKEVYFSLPALSEPETSAAIDNFITDQSKLETAVADGEKMRLGEYSLRRSTAQERFFKTSLDNVKIEPERVLQFDFRNASYTMSLREMIDLSDNSMIYGGRLNADTNLREDGKYVIFANHGAFVSKPTEPSLQRLADDLTKDLPPSAPNLRELKIQKLLDFVSNEIDYDYSEAVGSDETLKRPNEVLMSRSGDCSNKTILLASLLEHIGEDYILLYCPHHITVAVPQGSFPATNGLKFNWEQKTWVIAESTLAGFAIGSTRVKEARVLQTIKYVQDPQYRNVIFEADTLRPVEFR